MAETSTRVVIFDTTLRDGEQAPGFSLEVPAKVQMARALDALGVDIIEAGFPIASPADAEAVTHIAKKLRTTREACFASVVDGVKRARTYTDDVEFSAEDATRSDRDFLCRVVEAAIANGATTINLPDTVGYTVPEEIRDFFLEIRHRVPNADQAIFSTHCHDDLGLAVANSLAAFEGGVRQVECTINGIGERAGNASLEEIVMALRVRRDRLPYDTAIRSEGLYEASQL